MARRCGAFRKHGSSSLPAALPSFDLAPWTGWVAVEEPDFFALVTIAVLALRAPPRRADFALGGWTGMAVALAIVAASVGVVRGLLLPGVPGGSDLLELEPENALRIAKGLAFALLLLPFLRREIALNGDAPRLFAAGMTAGLALVAAAALAERAVFTGILNFDTAYRIVASFSSMHLGGGYVGAYAAMALPFALALATRRGFARVIAAGAAAGGVYTLVVTFARAAYGSAIVSSIVVALGWLALRRKGAPSLTLALPAALLAAGLGVIALAAADARAMEKRLAQLVPDLAWREDLWSAGLATRRPGVAAALLGSGSGTYARLLRATMAPDQRAGNLVLREDGKGRMLALEAGLPLYLGQKVALAPDRIYRIAFSLRSPDGGTIEASLCEKMLLYSSNCVDIDVEAPSDGTWRRFAGAIPTTGMLRVLRLGVLHRPLELSFTLLDPGTHAGLADISLSDPDGRELACQRQFPAGPRALVRDRRRPHGVAHREPVPDDVLRGRCARHGGAIRGRARGARRRRTRHPRRRDDGAGLCRLARRRARERALRLPARRAAARRAVLSRGLRRDGDGRTAGVIAARQPRSHSAGGRSSAARSHLPRSAAAS